MRGVNLLRLWAVCYAICRSHSITFFCMGCVWAAASTIIIRRHHIPKWKLSSEIFLQAEPKLGHQWNAKNGPSVCVCEGSARFFKPLSYRCISSLHTHTTCRETICALAAYMGFQTRACVCQGTCVVRKSCAFRRTFGWRFILAAVFHRRMVEYHFPNFLIPSHYLIWFALG